MTVALCATAIVVIALLWEVLVPYFDRRSEHRRARKAARAAGDVHAYDPEAMQVARGIFGGKVTYAENSYAALTGADALVIVTEWNEFREPDYGRMKKLMRSAGIFDGRNVSGPEQIRAQGFTYYSRGRP